MSLFSKPITSPVGVLTLVANAGELVAILWEKDDSRRVPLGPLRSVNDHPILNLARQQLDQYFTGQRTRFELPLASSGTRFQQAVWRALLDIPYGKTQSYSELAAALGKPFAARAVGAANGRNPLSIIVPCHRLVGADGSLTGFAGGLEAKRYLLDLEKTHSSTRAEAQALV
ncbi:methylated-DNA--[protein]-cysteine S-methyltransferase [Pelagibacterium sp. H642]|uniref:methylated-DNA--[protein]-cysteine S-methyltransferase n=1 Tax=Pelagibacterium sp. H642 TaxID=1881069 RepID=UPI00281607C3|nr:methylated-DNA--[protein]-cysteine S-methyltransferase [Pelagibacterium sp. H642]WMT90939.1 methylated-DNA--[protein]-cysteine S-methyltransferase [Pelagibacterium sp. H642]